MEIKVKEYAVEYTICYLFGARRLEKKEVPCNKAGYVKDADWLFFGFDGYCADRVVFAK